MIEEWEVSGEVMTEVLKASEEATIGELEIVLEAVVNIFPPHVEKHLHVIMLLARTVVGGANFSNAIDSHIFNI